MIRIIISYGYKQAQCACTSPTVQDFIVEMLNGVVHSLSAMFGGIDRYWPAKRTTFGTELPKDHNK